MRLLLLLLLPVIVFMMAASFLFFMDVVPYRYTHRWWTFPLEFTLMVISIVVGIFLGIVVIAVALGGT